MRPFAHRTLPEDHVTRITPREFELLVKDFLSETGQNLEEFDVQHDIKQQVSDGTYQIDVKAVFEVFGGSRITVLVECKHYASPVKREKVEILYSRLQSLGANKGILCSTSGFQQGAIEFAQQHGIALIWVFEGRFTYSVKSAAQEEVKLPADVPAYVGGYSYNFTAHSYTTSYLQPGYLDSLSAYILS